MSRRSPRIPEDDEISFISMQELAPTPIEDDGDDDDYLNLTLPHIQPVEKRATHLSASIGPYNNPSTRSLAFWRRSPLTQLDGGAIQC